MEENYVLKVRDISKSFPGTKALSNVTLDVFEGEVHALVGENGAGKTTLMNVISGVFQPDEGKIFFNGKEVSFSNPKESQDAGIGFVHQELALCQHISAAENIFIRRLPLGKTGLINHSKLYIDAIEVLRPFKSAINPKSMTKDLTLAQQQILEIAKALSLNCKLLILDEPTSSLTESETNTLFEIIKEIKSKGIGVLYISHKMNEIFEICDRITIFRDGKYVDTLNSKETNSHEVVCKMVGREINQLYPEKSNLISENILEVHDMNKKGVFKNISFSLRKGEILGFSGLVGAGRTEVARAICGIDEIDSGEFLLNGKKIEIGSYRDAIKQGICYMSENRKKDGLFLCMNVMQNITVAKMDSISNLFSVSAAAEKTISETFVKNLDIKVSSIKQKANDLSGGNQQKVMISKWLSVNPAVIFMDEPTRGIDVGAKSEIHKMLRRLSNEGVGIVVISSELPEIIGMCDRVIVMHEGVITGEVSEQEINEKNIILYASGQ